MEEALKNHLLLLNKHFYGLTTRQVRSFAFEFAEKNGLQSGFVDGKAGKEWLLSFMKRHPELSLRSPEPTSINRVAGFNKASVGQFFTLLRELLLKSKIQAHRVFNMDETGVQGAPHCLPKVLARKGQKQVGKVVSAERGESVTVVCAMSPTGIFIPPFFIFPRKRMRDDLKAGLPRGSEAVAHDSGYMTKEIFIDYLKHFISHTRPTSENPILLILDNHVSHVSLAAVEQCRENFITLLTIPPHTSHKMQPLDVSFFGPFKKRFVAECDKFMLNNPGSPINLCHIGGLVKEALLLTENSKTASNGFSASGIWPFNPDVFSDDDFLPAGVFDIVELDDIPPFEAPVFIEPAIILPIPKAKMPRKRRHLRVATILTANENRASQVQMPSTSHSSSAVDKEKKRRKQPTKTTAKKNERPSGFTCLYCCEKWENSRPGETWLRCKECMSWAHNECAGVSRSFVDFVCELCS
jgi:hypothetical protein